jgi:hypothetical protein
VTYGVTRAKQTIGAPQLDSDLDHEPVSTRTQRLSLL